MLPSSCITAVTGLCLTGVILAQHEVEFQFSRLALQMPENLGRRFVRNDWVIAPRVYQADVLRVSMCITESTSVRINDITYSNDGTADTIVVQIDGTPIVGQFTTHSKSDWGNLWSNQSSSGYIGQTGMLTPGRHELTFLVASSEDCFGIELWSLNVSVFTAVDPAKFWCGSSYSLAERKTDCGGSRVGDDVMFSSAVTEPTTTTPSPSYVKVTQQSQTTICLDKRNVKVVFSTGELAGTNIITRQDAVKTQAPQFSVKRRDIHGKLCEKEIWQLGEMDNSNNEFSSIYPGRQYTINLTEDANQERKFPMKLLPFQTSFIVINFDMPSHVDMKDGSAYFALGLVNLTKPVNIGLRYFNHASGNFSDPQYVTFTSNYQVFGWNIQELGKTGQKNIFQLFFDSDANVIMFDFLKLLYTKRDQRLHKTMIARNGHWKINGLRYETSVGMKVNADDITTAYNIEDAIIMHQMGDFSRYKTVLRVNSNGMFYPYKTFYIPQEDTEKAQIDISGFYFNQRSNSSLVTAPVKIESLFVDTTNDMVKAKFVDGSVLHLHLRITNDETRIHIINYTPRLGNNHHHTDARQHLIFTSTYIDDFDAAVNTIRNDAREQQILSDVGKLSGGYNFTMRKTTSSNLFYANNVININFPRF